MTYSTSSPGRPALLTAFDAVEEQLNDAADAALFGLTGDEVWEGIMTVRRLAARLDAVGLGLVAEAAGRDLANPNGADGDTAGLLRSRVLFTPAESQRRVQIARALGRDDLAATRTALGRGHIDLDQAGVLVDTVTALRKGRIDPDAITAAQQCLLGFARRFDHHRLAGLARRLLACLLPDREKKNHRKARNGRRLTLRNRGDGTHTLSGSLDDYSALLLAACLDPLAAPQPGPNGERDPRPAAMRHADALLELAAQYLRYGPRHNGEDHPADHTCPTPGSPDCTCHANDPTTATGDNPGAPDNPDSETDEDGDLGFADPDSLYDPGFFLDHDTDNNENDNEDEDEDEDGEDSDATNREQDGAGGPGGASGASGASGAGGHGTPGSKNEPGHNRPGRTARPAPALSPLARRTSRPGGAELIVTCDLEALLKLANQTCFGPETINHIPLPRDILEQLTCNGFIRRAIITATGIPLDVGRKSRTVTPAIRTAVILRDRHCTFPGCTRPHTWCDCHHCDHWTRDNGETSLDNIALVCATHHDKAHHGWDVRIGPHGHAQWRAPHHTDPTGTWHTNHQRQPRHPYDKPLTT